MSRTVYCCTSLASTETGYPISWYRCTITQNQGLVCEETIQDEADGDATFCSPSSAVPASNQVHTGQQIWKWIGVNIDWSQVRMSYCCLICILTNNGHQCPPQPKKEEVGQGNGWMLSVTLMWQVEIIYILGKLKSHQHEVVVQLSFPLEVKAAGWSDLFCKLWVNCLPYFWKRCFI